MPMKKISHGLTITNLAKETVLTTVENKNPSISNLATRTALTRVENKFPSVSNLVKKTDYDTKITDIEKNSLIISMINILTLQSLIL